MNNTIETNQSYQKFKEIFTARHIISQWLSAGSVLLCQVISLSADGCQHPARLSQPIFQAEPPSQSPDDCYLVQHLLAALNYNMVKVFFARIITKSAIGCSLL